MQATSRHDVGFVPEDSGSGLFDIHQCEEPERPLGMVEEQINIRILASFATCRRAEQIKMLTAELF